MHKAISINSKDNKVTISTIDNQYEFESLKDILNWFICNKYDVFLAWDLDETVSHILRLIPEKNLIEISTTNKTSINGYSIFYIAGKLFDVSKKDRNSYEFISCKIYHLLQYYPDYDEPKNLQELQVMIDDLLKALKQMNFKPTKLSSPVAIFEVQVLNVLKLPTLRSSNIPREAAMYAWLCGGKLWIEAMKIGKFQNVYDYDINSCFPSIAKTLIDTTGARWVHSDKILTDATYGFCHGFVTIFNGINVSPIIYRDEDSGKLSTPTGTWDTYITMSEIKFIKKWGIGEFEIIDGWYCFCQNENHRPLENIANRILKYKQSDNPLVKLLAKRMSVGGIYGKFGEEHKDMFGRHFNPVWFSYISAEARLAVADFIYRNQMEDEVVHISVDGILSTKYIENI